LPAPGGEGGLSDAPAGRTAPVGGEVAEAALAPDQLIQHGVDGHRFTTASMKAAPTVRPTVTRMNQRTAIFRSRRLRRPFWARTMSRVSLAMSFRVSSSRNSCSELTGVMTSSRTYADAR